MSYLKIRYILIFILILCSFGCKRHKSTDTNFAATSMETTQQKQDSAKKPVVHIVYDEPIEGYIVSADVFPRDDLNGSASLHFKKGDTSLNIKMDVVLLTSFLKKGEYGDGQTIVKHYNPFSVSDSLSTDHEFLFYDIDFDEENEIIVAYPWFGPRGTIAYEVYETDGSKREDIPFDCIDSQTRFNAKEKSITLSYYHGVILGSNILKYKRQFDGSFMLTDSTKIEYKVDFTDSIRTHYHRKGDKMVFDRREIIK